MALLRHLGLRRAHLLGYSYGAIIALQMALDFPEEVGALALLEPPLLNMVAGGPAFRQQMQPFAELYQRGHKTMAVEGCLETLFGPDYRDIMESALGPAAMTRAIADAETFLAYEWPALDLWHFSQALALRLTNPMLSIVGGATAPPLAESHELLMHWYSKAEEFEIPEATHALPLMCPQEIAVAVALFYARHPLEVSAGRIG
jgi:pimeloyl-ACP methyl ester carboxylesterase